VEPDDKNDLRNRTFEYSRRIIRLFGSLPNTAIAQVVGKQCLRSGTSIGANYREAYRSRSRAEFIAKIGDCLKEAEETQYWLELMIAEEIVSKNKLSSLVKETDELVAIFVSSMNTAKSNTTS
jgi:four helix bundle protein